MLNINRCKMQINKFKNNLLSNSCNSNNSYSNNKSNNSNGSMPIRNNSNKPIKTLNSRISKLLREPRVKKSGTKRRKIKRVSLHLKRYIRWMPMSCVNTLRMRIIKIMLYSNSRMLLLFKIEVAINSTRRICKRYSTN